MKQKKTLLLCHILLISASEWIICRSDSPDVRRYLPAKNYYNEENIYDKADHEEAGFVNRVNRMYSTAYDDRMRALDDSYSIGRVRNEVAEDRSYELNPSSPGSEYLRNAYSYDAARNGDSIELVADGSAVSDGSTSDFILNKANNAAAASKVFGGGNIAGEIKIDSKFKELPEEVYRNVSTMIMLPPSNCVCEGIDGTQTFFSINGSNDINFHFNGLSDVEGTNKFQFKHNTNMDGNVNINTEFDASKDSMFKKAKNAFYNFDAKNYFNSIFNGQKSKQFGTQFETNFNVDGNDQFDADYISGLLMNLVSDGKLTINSFATLNADQLKELYKKIFINMQLDTQGKIDDQAIIQLIAQINAEAKAQAMAQALADVNSQALIQGQLIAQAQSDAQAQAIAQAQAMAQANLDAQLQAQAQAEAQMQAVAEAQAYAQAQTQAQAQAQVDGLFNSQTNTNANKAISVEGGGGGGLFKNFKLSVNGGLNGGLNAVKHSVMGISGLSGGLSGLIGGGLGGGMSGGVSGGMSGAISGGVVGGGSVGGYGSASEEFHLSSRHPFGYHTVAPTFANRFYESTVYTSDGMRAVPTHAPHKHHTFGRNGDDRYHRY